MNISSAMSRLRPEGPKRTHHFEGVALTMGYTDDRGTPVMYEKVGDGRRFIGFMAHTPGTMRQTSFGARRALLEGPWLEWNWKNGDRRRGPAGKTTVHAVIQSAAWDRVVDAELRAYEFENYFAAVGRPEGWQYPIGLRPACTSRDGITARQWNGADYVEAPCPASECPYFQAKDCKLRTGFVFALNEPGFPNVPAYIPTGSADNGECYDQFAKAVTAEWNDLLERYGVGIEDVPFSWYNLPVVIEAYLKEGEIWSAKKNAPIKTWYPQIRVSVDGVLTVIFQRLLNERQALRRQLAGVANDAPLLLTSGPETPDVRTVMADLADADREVLAPATPEPAPVRQTAASRFDATPPRPHRSMVIDHEPAPEPMQTTTPEPDPEPPLIVRCRNWKTITDLKACLADITDPDSVLDTDGADMCMTAILQRAAVCIAKVPALTDRVRDSIRPYAPIIVEVLPDGTALLTAIGMAPAPDPEPATDPDSVDFDVEEDTPFTPAPTQEEPPPAPDPVESLRARFDAIQPGQTAELAALMAEFRSLPSASQRKLVNNSREATSRANAK